MLEKSKDLLTTAKAEELKTAEVIALRLLVSDLEENLIPHERAVATAQAHKEANDETWQRAVLGIVLGLRTVAEGHSTDGHRA